MAKFEIENDRMADYCASHTYIISFLHSLVKALGMQLMPGLDTNPFSVYCNKKGLKGMTASAIIMTSHIMLHIWDETTEDHPNIVAQLDVYTCSDLDLDVVREMIDHFFRPLDISELVLDRKWNMKILTKQKKEGYTMSHFTVAVITEDGQDKSLENALAPFHEFECTGQEKYIEELDITEEARKKYDESNESLVILTDGTAISRYDG